MSRHSVIRLALEALAVSRAPSWLPAAPDASGFVVTLHHVRPATRDAFQPNTLLSITPEFLDGFLAHFSSKGWRFVSVEEITAPGPADPQRIAVTLDDGYRNNLKHALPVFRRHKAPFTIFVCPGFSDRTSELWWEALERMLAANTSFEAPDGKALSIKTPDAKLKAFALWRRWLTEVAGETTQRVVVRALAEKYRLDLKALATELVMNWNEVRKIAADPLCTIGAHTMTHPALARLARDDALREIAESIGTIAAELGKRPTSLAFPYGYPAAAGPREAELAAAAGLTASFTTQPGYIPADGPRHGLPRVSINGLFQELRHLDVLLSPGLWTLRNRIRKRR